MVSQQATEVLNTLSSILTITNAVKFRIQKEQAARGREDEEKPVEEAPAEEAPLEEKPAEEKVEEKEAPVEEKETTEEKPAEQPIAEAKEEEYHPWWIGVKEIDLFLNKEDTERMDALFPATHNYKFA